MIGPSEAVGDAVAVLERSQALERSAHPGTGARDPGRGRQVERLEHERRDTPRPGAAVVRGVAQDQLVPGSGHRDVAQSALLRQRGLGGRRCAASKAGRQGQGVSATARREPAGDHPGQEDDGELETLRLVDRQDRDRVGVRVELGGGRIVAGFDQGRQVRRHEDGPIVGEQRGP